MTHTTRAYLGSAILLAIGCAELSQLTPDQRVQLAVGSVQDACQACGAACVDPSVVAVCGAFKRADDGPSEGPASGDGGPAPIIEERHVPDVGPHEGQGARAVDAGP